MKKKVVALCLVIAMAAVAVVGGTMAYFTDTDDANNTFLMKNEEDKGLEIVLDEAAVKFNKGTHKWTKDTEAKRVDAVVYGEDYPVYPGAVLPKDPTIHNTGSYDVYARVIVSFDQLNTTSVLFKDFFAEEGVWPNITEDDFAHVFAGYDKSKWDMEVRWDFDVMTGKAPQSITFTLIDPIAAGKDAPALFTAVNVSEKIDNTDAENIGNAFALDIHAEAVQKDGFSSAAAAFAATFDAE